MITFTPLDADRIAHESGIIRCTSDVCQGEYTGVQKLMLPEGADPYEFIQGVITENRYRGIRYADHATGQPQEFVMISVLK